MTTGRRRRMAVRVDQPPPSRPPVALIAGIVVVGLIVVGVLLLFNGQGGATPTPSAIARRSPTPGASASVPPSSSLTPTATPSGVPADTPTPAVATPPVSGSAPTGLTRAPDRVVTFVQLGIDNKSAPEAIPRRISFDVDGRGDVSVDLSDITAGTVRMCLWPGDLTTEPSEGDCSVSEGETLTRTPTEAGPWSVLLAGDTPGRSPTGTLVLRFAATNAVLRLADFRFQGLDSPNYTGFVVRVVAEADGQLNLAAAWDDGLGGDYPYLVVLTDLDGSGEPPIFEGEGDHAEATREVVEGHTYEVLIQDTQPSVIDAVFLNATITWP